jgi:AbrB family looped-hinge helix DNA binding protein
MTFTTLSGKGQVVIPKEVREHLGFQPGLRFAVVEKGNAVVLVPLSRFTELRGRLRGADPTGYRDRSDVE